MAAGKGIMPKLLRPTKFRASYGRLPHYGLHLPRIHHIVKISRIFIDNDCRL